MAQRPTRPPIQCVARVFVPEHKAAGREGDRLPLSSAEVKNMWRYNSTPQYVVMNQCLVN